ncbi:hypothetical protein SLE2022_181680 [Rubroshorea leprosula]
MLDSIVTLLSRPEQERVEEELEMLDIAESVGYTAAFVKLYNAGKKEEDPLTDIKDPKQFLVASLARLSSLSLGRYPQIMSENLEPMNQAALLRLCGTYSCTILNVVLILMRILQLQQFPATATVSETEDSGADF